MKSNIKNENQETKYPIDAKGQSIGRLASTVSTLLRGKNKPSFNYSGDNKIIVEIKNINQLKISEKKLNTYFYRHSGYPGGLKKIVWNEIYQKSPKNLFIKVVDNMIPANRRKKNILKNIRFI